MAARRASFLGVTATFNLDRTCRVLTEAFGWSIYLVGSALTRADYRDVDVRCILDDEEFARLFPRHGPALFRKQGRARLALLNAALSEWLSSRTGLAVDFQFQAQTEANEHQGRRYALGLVVEERDDG